MSSEEPIIKNSKFVKVINNMNEESEYDQNFDSKDEYLHQEMNDEIVFQAIYNIKRDLIKYIDDKSLPLAEFMTFGKLKKFIIKEILY